jgi:beta-glucosidase
MLDYNIHHGRTYMYFSGAPLYPFGFGLSYTAFSYSNLRLSAAKFKKNGTLTATVDVTNTGARDGDEVVQLSASHLNSVVERPQRELKGFRRIHLAARQTTSIQFTIPAQSLAWWNPAQHAWQVESDTVRFSVGSSSANLPLHQDASVVD